MTLVDNIETAFVVMQRGILHWSATLVYKPLALVFSDTSGQGDLDDEYELNRVSIYRIRMTKSGLMLDNHRPV